MAGRTIAGVLAFMAVLQSEKPARIQVSGGNDPQNSKMTQTSL